MEKTDIFSIFSFLDKKRMDPKVAADSDVSSVNGDFLEMEIGDNAGGMTDEEVKEELAALHQKCPRPARMEDKNKNKNPIAECYTSLATPKIRSVVVLPESTSSNKKSEAHGSSAGRQPKTKTKTKTSKRKPDKNGSEKNTLVALMAKVRMSGTNEASKACDKHTQRNRMDSPQRIKRVRSAGSTPEDGKKNPEKLIKLQGVNDSMASAALSKPNSNLIARRTLNVKVCIAKQPPTSTDLQAIKKFLQYQIEQAVADGAEFIPIFTEPCIIKRDGVYVFCSNLKCVNWVKFIAIGGIPGTSGELVVLPHETPLNWNPENIIIRVRATIPTRKPKEIILRFLADLNKEYNTEKWTIKRTRPKGASSLVAYMRIDKPSFDAICARDNKLNWILGPINIEREVHGNKPNRSRKAEKGKKDTEFRDSHLTPHPSRIVDSDRNNNNNNNAKLNDEGSGNLELKSANMAASDAKNNGQINANPHPKSKMD